jgi:pSer/pThr/pTyr-binding forkhead associated (FHA) protein
MPRLVVTAGPLAGQSFEVDSEQVIGRTEGDILVADSEVSRRHAVVRPVPEGIEVKDLGSLNGTWVDEARIEASVKVRDGGTIRFGETILTVEAPPLVSDLTATPAVTSARGATELEAHAAAVPLKPAAAARAATPTAWESTPAEGRRVNAIATRRVVPAFLSFGAVVATALALLLYFGLR